MKRPSRPRILFVKNARIVDIQVPFERDAVDSNAREFALVVTAHCRTGVRLIAHLACIVRAGLHCRVVARSKVITFDTVREIALKLPGAEEGTAYGTPVLRVNGHIFTGIPINKEVEPNSLGIWLTDFDQRDALIEEEPETYYVKPHYLSY